MLTEPPRRWYLRFGRMTLKGSVALGLLVAVSIYAARIPDQYACLQLINGYTRSSLTFDLVDLNSGRDVLDSRSQQSVFGIPSPNGKFSALFRPDEPGSPESTSSLIIQRISDSTIPAQSVVVQRGIADTGGGYNRFRNIRWSADSSRLAYLWSDDDQKIYLSVVNADGSGGQTALYGILPAQSNSQNSRFSGIGSAQISLSWAADPDYLSITQAMNNAGTQITLWSVSGKLQRIDFARESALRTGAWSPRGAQFAGIAEGANGARQIVLWSPNQQASLPFAADKAPDQIIWSPGGQFAALESRRPCTLVEGCVSRWSFDIVRSDGTLQMTGIDGAAWTRSSSGQVADVPALASWSADGASWVFLRDRLVGAARDVVALHVADKRYETVASDVVSDLASDMLYVASFRRPPSTRQISASIDYARKRIVLPTWHEGKIRVDLADIDGKHRTTLVQGADSILDSQFNVPGGSNHFWSPSGDLVVVAWASGTTDQDRWLHLTWAQADGSGRHEISDHFDGITNIQVIANGSQKWLGYTAKRADRISIELAEVATGQHYRLLNNLEDAGQWLLTPSPDGSLAALQLGASIGRFYGESRLYLVALDGTAASEVSSDVTGPAQWSPDGSQLAYLRRDSNSSQSLPYAQVITPDRSTLRSVPLYQAGTSQPRLLRWSKCS
jgi:hypothetical protein